MTPVAAFVVFFVIAGLIAVITALLMDRYHAKPLAILATSGSTFGGVLTLAMVSYAFLT
jgi:membrane protein YqaA with SNARE-associated domain